MTKPNQQSNRQRDASALLLMGPFLGIIALLVLLGTLWSDGFSFPVIVNVVCGILLLVLGIALLFVGLRWRQGNGTTENETRP